MPFRIIRNDITKMKVDAIVNTANPNPLIGGGTDSAIYRAAGEEKLLAERRKIGRILRGQAFVTPAFQLPAKYIIHTVGPVWRGGFNGEPYTLRCCYENSLKLAREKACESIAFPLISTGVYKFPKDLALQIVISVVSSFLMENDMMIYLVVFDEKATRLSEKLFDKMESRIDDSYVQRKSREEYYWDIRTEANVRERFDNCSRMEELPPPQMAAPPSKKQLARRLSDLMKKKDETFQQMLLRLIQEKGMTNAEAYTKANQDKKLFSKIKNHPDYQPKKKTALAFALALELSLDETKDLLARAGYALSPSSDFDKVITYCIETKEYNIYEIEIILYDLGLDTLCNY